MDDQKNNFAEWCILETFGHRRLAGKVSEVTIGGGTFIRIDIPGGKGRKEFSQYYSPSAVYCISPTTEEICRQLSAQYTPEPVHRFELPGPEQIDENIKIPGADWTEESKDDDSLF